MRDRIHAALAGAEAPNGVPLADVLYDLYRYEMGEQGSENSQGAWSAVSDADLNSLGATLVKVLEGQGQATLGRVTLPGGTEIQPLLYGYVLVGSDYFGLDVDRPGLVPGDELSWRIGGSNLRLLIALTVGMLDQLPYRPFGAPHLVERFDGSYVRELIQFPPLEWAGGAVIEQEMDFGSCGELFCAYSRADVAILAEGLVQDLRTLWNKRNQFRRRVQSFRNQAQRTVRRLRQVSLHAVAIQLSRQGFALKEPTFTVEFAAWDHSFRRGIVRQKIGDGNTTIPLNVSELDRADEIVRLRSVGADGQIDPLAREVARAAPQGLSKVLSDLATNFETSVEIPGGQFGFRFRLFWRDGTIRARSDHSIVEKLQIYSDLVQIREWLLPETVAAGLVGRPLSAVFDHPFSCDTRIRAITYHYADVNIELEPDIQLVNCREARIWAEPSTFA